MLEKIIKGQSSRFALCVGPCSLHDEKGALMYAERLLRLQETVPHLLVMRAFAEKSRTALGWKGYVYTHGIDKTRHLLERLASLGLPLAYEFVNPLLAFHFADLITWGFIGARSVTCQTHRELSSLLTIPVGMKNAVCGDLAAAINAVKVARTPQIVYTEKGAVQSSGNPLAHAVLRGSNEGPNTDHLSIETVYSALQMPVLIDCAHGNSGKDPHKQTALFSELTQRADPRVFGYMLESHIEGGKELNNPYCSITDPCVDWETTERLFSSIGMKNNACLDSAKASPSNFSKTAR